MTRSDPWYREGLRFACTECGACCTGQTGYVWVTVPEAEKMAAALGLSLDEFGGRYLRTVASRYSLLEDPQTGACNFLDGKRCSMHRVRPSQCRSFPFWSSNLKDSAAWQRAGRECEGIDEDACIVEAAEIDRLRGL